MSDGDIFDAEGTKVQHRPRPDPSDLDIGRAGFRQAARFDEARREGRREDAAAQLGPQGGERANVVFMRVRDQKPQKIAADFLDEGHVGQHEIDAGKIGPRKGEAAIHHQPFAPASGTEAVKRRVHADFAKAAERREDEFAVVNRHKRKPDCSRTLNSS